MFNLGIVVAYIKEKETINGIPILIPLSMIA
jgi:hypothetical protein